MKRRFFFDGLAGKIRSTRAICRKAAIQFNSLQEKLIELRPSSTVFGAASHLLSRYGCEDRGTIQLFTGLRGRSGKSRHQFLYIDDIGRGKRPIYGSAGIRSLRTCSSSIREFMLRGCFPPSAGRCRRALAGTAWALSPIALLRCCDVPGHHRICCLRISPKTNIRQWINMSWKPIFSREGGGRIDY